MDIFKELVSMFMILLIMRNWAFRFPAFFTLVAYRLLSVQQKTGASLLSAPDVLALCDHDFRRWNIRESGLRPAGHVVQLPRVI